MSHNSDDNNLLSSDDVEATTWLCYCLGQPLPHLPTRSEPAGSIRSREQYHLSAQPRTHLIRAQHKAGLSLVIAITAAERCVVTEEELRTQPRQKHTNTAQTQQSGRVAAFGGLVWPDNTCCPFAPVVLAGRPAWEQIQTSQRRRDEGENAAPAFFGCHLSVLQPLSGSAAS